MEQEGKGGLSEPCWDSGAMTGLQDYRGPVVKSSSE